MFFCRKKSTNRINNISLTTVALRVGEGKHFSQQPSTFPLLSLSLSNSKTIGELIRFLDLPSPTLNAFVVRVNMLTTSELFIKNAALTAVGGGTRSEIEFWVLRKWLKNQSFAVVVVHHAKSGLRRGKNGLH